MQMFLFVSNCINRNRILIVWKGYHNVIHFRIISDFCISIYPITNLDVFRLGYIL